MILFQFLLYFGASVYRKKQRNRLYSKVPRINEQLIIKNRRSGEFKSIQEVLGEVQKNLEKLSESKGEITGILSCRPVGI